MQIRILPNFCNAGYSPADYGIHAVEMGAPAALILEDRLIYPFHLPVGKIREQLARLPHSPQPMSRTFLSGEGGQSSISSSRKSPGSKPQ